MKLKYIIFSVFIFFQLVSCNLADSFSNMPFAVNGVIDLKDWNLSEDGPVSLDGEWEFYWEQFLNAEDFSFSSEFIERMYVSIPGVWKGQYIAEQKLPGTGYATYRLTIINNRVNESLALKLPTISSAYTLYIDGESVASSGISGSSKLESFPETITQIIEFNSEKNSIELVFHVSNYSYDKGGLWFSIILGTEDAVKRVWDISFFLDIFLFSSIFIMGIYHFSIFILRRKDKAALFFGLFCILISIRTIVTGQILITYLVPSFPWSILVRLEFISFYLGAPFYVTYLSYIFPKDLNRIFVRSFNGVSLIFLLFVIFFSVKIFTATIFYYQFLTLAGSLYMIYMHILTVIRKRDHSIIISIGFFVILSLLVNDILFISGLINTRELFSLGLYIFILIQSFTLANKFMKSFNSVEQLSKEIADTEKKYKSIFENSTEGIYQSSVDGQFLMVNPAFVHIFGYETPEEILDIKFIQNWYIDKDQRKTLVKKLMTDGLIEDAKSKVYKKNGDIIHIKEDAHVVCDQNSEIKYFEGNIIDITQSTQIEKLKLERAAAEAASKTKSEFLANMSHEIRTPMNAIIGFTDILFDSEKEPKRKEHLGIIKNAGVNLLKLINDILDFSKIEAGKMDIEEEAFSITDLLNSIENMFKKKSESKELDFSLDFISPIPAFIYGDKHRLVQILNNLIENALKFTEKGSIGITCKYKDGKIWISVKDTGIGIAEDKQETVFLSFSQADMTTGREYGGTGLGLTISKKLAELLGGHISLESIPDVGTTFTIEIPFEIVKDKKALNDTKMSTSVIKPSISNSKKLRILLAEDNKINQTLVSALLNEINLDCDITENGKEALQRLISSHYDLLLLDMQMPVMDGLELIKHIRDDKNLKQIYVIALTANAMAGDEERYLIAGCNDYISKPIDRHNFKIKINKSLNFDK